MIQTGEQWSKPMVAQRFARLQVVLVVVAQTGGVVFFPQANINQIKLLAI